MTTTVLWDQPGERVYETGVDRGVLYLPNEGAVPWNGLISVTEKASGGNGTPLYHDGVKYGDALVATDFEATLRAYTYPDEFMELEGTVNAGNGLFVTGQKPQRFGLSYRTKIGNDDEGIDYGYKIHILYNLLAFPSQKSFNTQNAQGSAMEFEWTLTSVPGNLQGYRATSHIILDSRHMGSLLIADIENTLYGDGIVVPRLPEISTLVSFIAGWVIIRIIDHNDGTWTAEGPDEFITMLDATTFEIGPNANAEYLDADTYVISDTTY
jgi:hypothetical protein